jgi:PAS domain S-box-containing protein
MIALQVQPYEEAIAEVARLRQQVAELQAEVKHLKTSPTHGSLYPLQPASAEPSLWDTGQDYKRLLESVTNYIYSVKVERGRAMATLHGPACVHVTGYTPEEYQAEPHLWHCMIHEQDRPLVMAQIASALVGEESPPVEHRIVHKSGAIRWVRNTPVLRYDDSGRYLGYDGLITDITERKQIEAELTQRNSELLSLQYAGATIAASLDLDFVLNAFAQEMVNLLAIEGCAIFSWDQTSDAAWLMAHTGITHNKDKPQTLLNFGLSRQALRERRAQQLSLAQPDLTAEELAYLQRHQFKCVLILPMEAQGYLVGLVELVESRLERRFQSDEIALAQLLANQAAGAIQNARLYEQAQQEIRARFQKELALRRSQARLTALLDTMPDTMFRLSRSGQYLDYHPGKEKDSAILPADCVGQNIRLVLPVEVAELTLAYVAKAVDTGIIQIFEYQLALLYSVQSFEIRLVVSGPDEVLGIIRNITEGKRLMEQAIQAERLAALGRLSAALTHEINNPLQSMRTHLDLVLDYELKPGEDRKFLEVIRREIDRLNEISQRILNFARPHPASRRWLNVTTLMEEVLILAGKQLQSNSIKVAKDFRQVPLIWADPDQLMQVFLNIILNTYEVLPANGQLHLAIFREDEQITISFTNNGPIIAPEILPHIFEPFFTTKPEGSGLGLWVSHNLIQQHAGLLTAQNLGKTHGVAFTIILPIKFEQEVSNDASSANQPN